MKLFHVICESVKKNQLFHINEHQRKAHYFLRFSHRFRHMYHIIIYTYVALTLRFCRSGSFYHRYASLLLSQLAVVFPRRNVCRGILSAGILHEDMCVSVAGTCRQSVAARTERTFCENPRAKTEGERADAAVHPLTLALCLLTKRPRCTYAHICMCRTMTGSVDDATRIETGTRHEMKRKI